MNENALLFIQKAIEKTKNQTLQWYSLRNHNDLQTMIYKASENTFSPLLTHSEPLSFYSEYNNGCIFLLCHESVFTRQYSIEVQIESSTSAIQLASSNDSLEISTQLKRLYNIVEDCYADINAFVNDFLNS